MKKINKWIINNKAFIVCLMYYTQWILLALFTLLSNNNELERFWLNSSFIITIAGSSSLVLLPICIIIIFSKRAKKYLLKITDFIFVINAYLYLLGMVHFIRICIGQIKEPTLVFSVPSFLVIFLIIEKLSNVNLKNDMNNKEHR